MGDLFWRADPLVRAGRPRPAFLSKNQGCRAGIDLADTTGDFLSPPLFRIAVALLIETLQE